MQLCGRLGAIFSQQWILHNHKEFRLCYSHKIRYIIIWHPLFKSLYIYILSIWPQMVVRHNRRSTWTRPLRELGDALLGGHCGEMTELEGREPTINTPPHLSQHPNKIHEKERFWFEEHRNQMRTYDTTWR